MNYAGSIGSAITEPLSNLLTVKLFFSVISVCSVISLLIVSAFRVDAQEQRTEPATKTASVNNVLAAPGEDYRIGAGDVIEIAVEDAPELSASRRINANGTFLMGFLGRLSALGRTPEELEKMIADGLRGRYLKNPQVRVSVAQYNSRSFFIQGAVRSPGVYQMEGKPTLLKLITLAGGLQETHGSTAFIIRELKEKKSETVQTDESGKIAGSSELIEGANYEMVQASISGLLKGNFGQNLVIEPGDIINIPPRDVFFVAGEVHAPGQFALKDGTTLRQAISLAQGTTVRAAQNRSVIFREDPQTGRRIELKLDIGAVMNGKQEDVLIAPNDVIIVPNSRSKTVGTTLLSAFGTNVVSRGVIIR
jgi:polysaccharide export outer membrane protein